MENIGIEEHAMHEIILGCFEIISQQKKTLIRIWTTCIVSYEIKLKIFNVYMAIK